MHWIISGPKPRPKSYPELCNGTETDQSNSTGLPWTTYLSESLQTGILNILVTSGRFETDLIYGSSYRPQSEGHTEVVNQNFRQSTSKLDREIKRGITYKPFVMYGHTGTAHSHILFQFI